jgi:hypothetical protein
MSGHRWDPDALDPEWPFDLNEMPVPSPVGERGCWS